MAGKEVIVSVIADTKKFQAAWRRLAHASGLKDLQRNMAGIAKSAAVAGGAMAAAAGGIGVALAGMGANLEQSRGAVIDVFKDSSAQALEFSRNAARNVGLAGNAYNELATIIGSQLKNAGTPMTELAGKTNNLITLGADLAAMFGGTTQDAVSALSSALKGERDPIERYGVSLKQAAIDAKAAELGFQKVGASFDQEAQTAATLALIMEQTTDAHGKFAREGDTLAHHVQVWKAVLTDLAERIGEKLTPYITRVSQYLSDRLSPAIERLSTWIDQSATPAIDRLIAQFQSFLAPAISTVGTFITNTLIPALSSIAGFIVGTIVPGLVNFGQALWQNRDIIVAVAGFVGVIMTAWKAWIAVMNVWRIAQLAATAAQTAFNLAMAMSPIVWVVAAIAALAAGFYVLYQRSETVRNAVSALWSGIQSAAAPVIEWIGSTVVPFFAEVWDNVKVLFSAAWNYVADQWKTLGAPLFAAIVAYVKTFSAQWSGIWEGVKLIVSGAWQIISSIISTALGVIKGIFSVFTGVLTGDWRRAWEGIKTIVTSVINGIRGIIQGVCDVISGQIRVFLTSIVAFFTSTWQAVQARVKTAWDNLVRAVADGIIRVVKFLKDLPTNARNAVGNLGSVLWDAGVSLIRGFIDGIRSMISSVKSTLQDLTASLTSWKGPESLDRVLLTHAGQLVIDGFIKGLESRYSAVQDSLHSLTQSIGETPISIPGARLPVQTARAHGCTINLYSLTPTVETGRTIAQALAQYQALNGAGR